MAAVISIFFCVSATCYGGSWMAARRRAELLRRRIMYFSDGSEEMLPIKEQNRFSIFAFIDGLIRNFSFPAMVRKELNKANWSLKISEFGIIVVLLAAVPGLLVIMFSDRTVLAIIFSSLGGMSPLIYLKYKQSVRKKLFGGQLLEAITIISNSLKSGYSFLQSMDLVSREMPAPISEEFRKMLQEVKLGIAFESAVDRMTQRVESDDLDLVITGVKIQREVGGNLTEILDKIAHTIRERVRIKGQIQTLTAQGRLSGMILGLLPVALGMFLYTASPEYMMTLFVHPAGKAMLVMAAISQILGVMIIKKIIDIKV